MKPLYAGTIKHNGITLYPLDYYIWDIYNRAAMSGRKMCATTIKYYHPGMHMNSIRASILRLTRAKYLPIPEEHNA